MIAVGDGPIEPQPAERSARGRTLSREAVRQGKQIEGLEAKTEPGEVTRP